MEVGAVACAAQDGDGARGRDCQGFVSRPRQVCLRNLLLRGNKKVWGKGEEDELFPLFSIFCRAKLWHELNYVLKVSTWIPHFLSPPGNKILDIHEWMHVLPLKLCEVSKRVSLSVSFVASLEVSKLWGFFLCRDQLPKFTGSYWQALWGKIWLLRFQCMRENVSFWEYW